MRLIRIETRGKLTALPTTVSRRREREAVTLPAVVTLKRYSKALEYEYRVKTVVLDTIKRYSILSLTLYLE
jgi:hypothetical protein